MSMTMPRFTIERLRTLVLIGGVLLVAAIVTFLAAGKWTRRFLVQDLPKHLGVNIEQQADGVNYTQTSKGKTIFKLHAARAVTMKAGGNTVLHDVKIDLYGEDGQRADTISGSEFEYDAKAGVATAAGAVEITMMRPGVKPAVASLRPGSAKSKAPVAPGTQGKAAASGGLPVNGAAILDDQIHVKTSGLTFNQKTGVATTEQRVDFALRQGNGNSVGATYDSQNGLLILDRAVELHVDRPGGPVTVHANHAEFEHDEMLCKMTQAKAEFTGSSAQAADALMHFREDGSVAKLDGSGGVDLQTRTGGHVTAPVGSLEFDENNHPQHGLLEGGARLEMNQPNRQIDAASPTARLSFDNQGELSQAHMEHGVVFHSEQQGTTAKGAAAQIRRSWKSQMADVTFVPVASAGKDGTAKEHAPDGKPSSRQSQNQGQNQGRVEPRTIHGYGGVVVTSETTSGGVVTPSRLAADTVVAELAPGGAISSLVGTGNASFDERTAAGVHQASSADQLDVRFVPDSGEAGKSAAKTAKNSGAKDSGSEIASIVEVGHVVLVQDPPAGHSVQTGSKGGTSVAATGVRATANRADYDGQSEVLHLTGSPRVRDGALDMTADKIDFARLTGDAFAHGDVRASWVSAGDQKPGAGGVIPASSNAASGQIGSNVPGASLLGSGGNGPIHAIAAEAELHQATQEAVFRGAVGGQGGIEPRLWQSANSVSAPVIVLNRQKMTLTAESSGVANPVRTVLISNAAGKKRKDDGPSVIRVRSGDLHYSEGERLALFHAGQVGAVTAETAQPDGTATIVSQQTDVTLLPAGARAGSANSSVDRLTARGHVTADWPDRRGTGEKLVYLSEDETFTLTGTSAAPPRITDQARGSVTGAALIYHSREDSVTVEGDGGKTETDTRSKK